MASTGGSPTSLIPSSERSSRIMAPSWSGPCDGEGRQARALVLDGADDRLLPPARVPPHALVELVVERRHGHGGGAAPRLPEGIQEAAGEHPVPVRRVFEGRLIAVGGAEDD